MTSTVTPFQLDPILKPRVWGGRGLAELGKTLPPEIAIGESWEVADLPPEIDEGRNQIMNGPWGGQTLREVMQSDAAALLGTARPSDDGGFPLLIKFLDARENLSVQVHPTAAYVAGHPGTWLKNEAWFILDAEPGAVLYRGLREGLTAAELEAHITSGEVVDDLLTIPAVPGECHYLPSGTCHALGAGILVAEVQTPSDTTFRLFDWGRTGRELHVDAALKCIDLPAPAEANLAAPRTTTAGDLRSTMLTHSDWFTIERIEAVTDTRLDLVTNNQPVVFITIDGAAAISGGGDTLILHRGGTAIAPAALHDGTIQMTAGAALLRVELPAATDGIVA